MTCRWCQDAERNYVKAEELVAAGLSTDHPLVESALRRAQTAQRRAHGPIVTLGGCPEDQQ